MLGSHPLASPYPISNSRITDSVQTTGKYFALVDLANVFCLVSISVASQLQFAATSQGCKESFPGSTSGTAKLCHHIQPVDQISIASAFFQEHRYDITWQHPLPRRLVWNTHLGYTVPTSFSTFGFLLSTYSLFMNFTSKLKSTGTPISALNNSTKEILATSCHASWCLWTLSCPRASDARSCPSQPCTIYTPLRQEIK